MRVTDDLRIGKVVKRETSAAGFHNALAYKAA